MILVSSSYVTYDPSTEGSISIIICLFDTSHNASISKDIDVLKLRLTCYDTFYNVLWQIILNVS